jgi:hypothetical protein
MTNPTMMRHSTALEVSCVVPNYDEINERHGLITEPFAEKIKAALEELIAEHYGPFHGLVAVKIGKAEKECVGPLVR